MNTPPAPATGPAADAARILRARARALARPPAPARTTAVIEVLQFRLAQEHYAVETRWVREVVPLRDLAPLPGTPPFVRGIVNARGHILPVYDLKKFFDLPEQGLTDLHCVIIVQEAGVELGLLADAISGVTTLDAASLQPALPTLTGIRADYLKGVAAGPLVVLDLARIFADPKIIVQEGADT